MTKVGFLIALLSTLLVCCLPATPAQAGAARTFVSAAGSDSNNCINTATPCRHFATAFAATNPGGEIYVLDPANYGSLIITHAVSIQGHGWGSVSPPASGAAVTINASPGDVISLHGLTLGGGGISNVNGVVLNSGTKVEIVDCTIRDYDSNAILMQASNDATLTISNSYIANNANGIAASTGINFNNVATGFTFTADRILMTDNRTGAVFTPDGGAINAAFVNSVLDNNTTDAIRFLFGPSTSRLTLINTNFNENGTSVEVNGNLNFYLSHVNDINPTTSQLNFKQSGVNAFGDGTNHVTLSGPGAPAQLDSWALQ